MTVKYFLRGFRGVPGLPFSMACGIVEPVNNTVNALVERLLNSYAELGGINHIDGVNLPSKSVIGQISADLLRLLFPGFFDDRPVHSASLKADTAILMDSVRARLEIEIGKSLEYCPPAEIDVKNLEDHARSLTEVFLGTLPRIREILQTDAEAAFQGDPAALSEEEVIVAYPCLEAIAVQRMAHELYLQQVGLIPRIMTEWAHARTGIDLHPGAQIGTHFFIDHGTGTVVGETTTIGNHVKMYQGVGLVARSLSGGQQLRGHKRHPTIEDHVTLYAGATIVGGDTVIGRASTVGGNVFLTHSVPPNSLVLYEAGDVKVFNKLEKSAIVLDYQI
jgi:serine O-acetyltransferase